MAWFVSVLEVSPVCHSSVQDIYYVSMQWRRSIFRQGKFIYIYLLRAITGILIPLFGEKAPILFPVTFSLQRQAAPVHWTAARC